MLYVCLLFVVFFFKQKTAYEMRISDWSSDVCSSDLTDILQVDQAQIGMACRAADQRTDARNETTRQYVAFDEFHRFQRLLIALVLDGDRLNHCQPIGLEQRCTFADVVVEIMVHDRLYHLDGYHLVELSADR